MIIEKSTQASKRRATRNVDVFNRKLINFALASAKNSSSSLRGLFTQLRSFQLINSGAVSKANCSVNDKALAMQFQVDFSNRRTVTLLAGLTANFSTQINQYPMQLSSGHLMKLFCAVDVIDQLRLTVFFSTFGVFVGKFCS